MKKIFLNGCFDILTVGHFNLLLFARYIADDNNGHGEVIVAIDEDYKIQANKGLRRPIFNVFERGKALLDLKIMDKPVVNEIQFFHTDLELEKMISRIKPDYIVKGGDWRDKYVVGSEYAKVLFYDRVGEYSTTDIIKRCQAKIIVK